MMRSDLHGKMDSILDAAETLYARAGAEALSLRSIAEKAGVNLAAINYYFRSKELLTQRMLHRRLSPLHAERLKLLSYFSETCGTGLSTEHIVAALILPAIRKLGSNPDPVDSVNPIDAKQFFLRTAADPSPLIRLSMAKAFADVGRSFDDAFCAVHPSVPRHEVLWRVHIFFNAFPGTIANQNTLLLVQESMRFPNWTVVDILARFTAVLSATDESRSVTNQLDQVSKVISSLMSHPELSVYANSPPSSEPVTEQA